MFVKAKLIQTRELSADVRHFDFEALGVESFVFEPGQFVSVVKTVDGKPITRAYSIASPRMGNRFSLCLNRVDNGLLSPYLFSLQPGDQIEVQNPLGYFTMRHPGHHSVFIATGTGIAPFRSMLLEHLPKTHPQVTLLFGVRHEQGLLYREEFEDLASRYEGFRFMPTVTRPADTWLGKTGRVQLHLEHVLHAAGEQDPATLDVYICGLKEMVDDVRQELKRRGFDRKQVFYERYD